MNTLFDFADTLPEAVQKAPIIFPAIKKRGIDLRPYQAEATDAAIAFFSGYKRPEIAVLPTGAGKSIIIAEIVKRLNSNVLVLQPSKEILNQNYDKLARYSDVYDIGKWSSSVGEKNKRRVTFATIGSVRGNPHLWKDCEYCIIDECHVVNAKDGLSMYMSFFKATNMKAIGLTATPYRLHASQMYGSQIKMLHRTNPKFFANIFYKIQNRRLFDDGFLCPLKYAIYEQSNQNFTQKTSDFDQVSVQKYYIPKTRTLIDEMMSLVKSQNRNKTLIFVTTLAMCAGVQEALRQNGHICNFVSGETPARERDSLIYDFKTNKDVRFMVNVGVLTTGFDMPNLDCICLIRPTMSLSLYYQMLGRGIRICNGKTDCLVIDFSNNYKRFGKIEDLHIAKEDNGLDNIFTYKKGVRSRLGHVNLSLYI